MLEMLTRFRQRTPEPRAVPDTRACLLTIGYQGYSQFEFIRVLTNRAVTVLCDVRRSGTSRNAGFKRLPLRSACASSGIRYEHLWQLGLPAEQRRTRRPATDRADRFEDYRVRILPNQTAHLELIHAWLMAGERVALVGFDRSPTECHRSCVAEQLVRTFGDACIPLHL
jgi:uncharacterized protein (DUF488 family)